MNAKAPSLARSLLWPAICTGLAFILLLGLGLWQLRRLEGKETLIAHIETRARVTPADVPPLRDWPSLARENYDYSHVRASGHFELGREALIYSAPPEGFGPEPGFLVIAPFVLDKGGVVLVDRGFIAASKARDDARSHRPGGAVTITGLMRAPQARNIFTPADDPEHGLWYTSDPAKIAAHLHIAGAAPFTIVLDPPAPGAPQPADGLPRPAASHLDIVNNHLSYAITWFGLALALAVVFAAYARGEYARAFSRGPMC